MWPALCGGFQPSSGKNRVPKMYLADRCELCVLEWGRMDETMKGPASLEVPDLRKPGTGILDQAARSSDTVEISGWRRMGRGGSVSSRMDWEGQSWWLRV